MLRLVYLAVFAVALLLATPFSYAAPIHFFTYLDGLSEFPVNASPGVGTAFVDIDTVAHTLHVNVVFSGLTAGVTAAHIHCCVSPSAAPPTASVATTTPTFPGFPSGVTSGTYDMTFDTTQASTFRAGFITANGGTPAGAEAVLATGL